MQTHQPSQARGHKTALEVLAQRRLHGEAVDNSAHKHLQTRCPQHSKAGDCINSGRCDISASFRSFDGISSAPRREALGVRVGTVRADLPNFSTPEKSNPPRSPAIRKALVAPSLAILDHAGSNATATMKIWALDMRHMERLYIDGLPAGSVSPAPPVVNDQDR
jgi:hypothetical protein